MVSAHYLLMNSSINTKHIEILSNLYSQEFTTTFEAANTGFSKEDFIEKWYYLVKYLFIDTNIDQQKILELGHLLSSNLLASYRQSIIF